MLHVDEDRPHERGGAGAAPALAQTQSGRDVHAAHALMSFAELLEALVRVGLVKWPAGHGPDKLSLADRVDRAVQAVAALKAHK